MYLLLLSLPFLFSLFLFLFANFIGFYGLLFSIHLFTFLLFAIFSPIFFDVFFNGSIVFIPLFNWILPSPIAFVFDSSSILMLGLILIIFSIVLHYSLWYLSSEVNLFRFFAFLSIFTFSMLLLVLSSNLLTMFIGWEGVGITSYLLINYWYGIIQANKSAIKALLFNKVGDLFFILAIIIDFIFNNFPSFHSQFPLIISWANNLFIFSIIFAAMAKSAQFLFDSWLGDAMFGPTPVSALLHAATMVTAGIFLILRFIPLHLFNPFILHFGIIISLLTIILGGFIALFQNDLKKVIAYSTCSQLGFMFLSGLMNLNNISFFHLIIHGFFKALLFLSAGILIHSFNNNQDSRKSSLFIFKFPISYIYFLLASFSIIAFPFFSPFYSKDFILDSSFFNPFYIPVFSIIGSFLTISYSFKLFFNLFFSSPKSCSLGLYSSKLFHDEPLFKSFLILIFGSLSFGLFFHDLFYSPIFFFNFFKDSSFIDDFHHTPLYFKLIPIFFLPPLLLFSFFFNYFITFNLSFFINWFLPAYSLFNFRFFIIFIYNSFSFLLNPLFKLIDNGFLHSHSSFKRSFYS